MQFISAFFLILKYWGPTMELIKQLEKDVQDGITTYEIHKANDKIELVFKGRDNEAQRASTLNDVFRK